jgi:acyl-homoserine lactone synthase
MMYLVTEENRRNFRRELFDMHRQRKQVFVDQMRWPLPCEEGLEIDEFDTDAAFYLLNFGADGALQASARLLPTDRPHILDTVFPQLCSEGVPRGPNIWEATRFCPAPGVKTPEARHQLLGVVIAGILEAGLLFGMDATTFVAGAAMKPLALDAGWSVKTLGPAQRYRRDRVTACMAALDPDSLRGVRARHQITGPVLRYGSARQAA